MSAIRRIFVTVEHAKYSFITNIWDGKLQDYKYRVVHELILYKYPVYLVLESNMKEKISTMCHDTSLAS